MTKREAHALLDSVRDGRFPSASEATIAEALRLTGDLAREPLVDQEPLPIVTIASHLNRSSRVMRGAGEVVT